MKSNVTDTPEAIRATGMRERLAQELTRRSAVNPRYSLRAFARHLDIDHSSLSQVLRAKRPLPHCAPTIEKLGSRLGSPTGRDRGLWVLKHAMPRGVAAVLETRRLTREAANLVSELVSLCAPELVRLDCFRPDSRWIASVLGMTAMR